MLYEVFEALQESIWLKGVAQTWGRTSDLPPAAAPRIAWIPTRDTYAAPLEVATPLVVNGERIEVESIWSRWAGCDLELYVPAGPDGPRALEILVNAVHVGLRELLLSTANYRLFDGAWRDRGSLSDATLCYVQPIQVAVPIYRLEHAQLLEAFAVGRVRPILPE